MGDETEERAELEAMKLQVEKRRKKIKKDLSKDDTGFEVTPEFIRQCGNENEEGDGKLFAALHEDAFTHNKTERRWYIFEGHSHKKDIHDQAKACVANVAEAYREEGHRVLNEIQDIKEDDPGAAKKKKKLNTTLKKINSHIQHLRKEQGRINCLKFAHTNIDNPLSSESDEFDKDPFLLAVKNGVIDLKTGELRDGRPEDRISKASPIPFNRIDEAAPTWEKALSDIFQDNQELIDYLQRLFGYAITGLTSEHVLPVFWGIGRNGKSTVVEAIQHVLGPLAAPVPAEVLLDQGKQNSKGPTPEILALKGLRIAFCSESDDGRRFSPSKVKWLSSSDCLTGRSPYDKDPTTFYPTHQLILSTNAKPHAPADDFAFWERLQLIPFEVSFVKRDPQADNERPADKELPEKLKREAAGILSWLITGSIKWQFSGLNPPAIVIEETAKYRRDQDTLLDFIEDCCILNPEEWIQAADIYTAFRGWWKVHVSKKWVLGHRKFGELMVKKFRREKVGSNRYYGLMLSDEGEKYKFSADD